MSNNIPNVKHIIAVSSGKGGVGKSTTAMNLAVALSLQGKTVGLLDADIYGPSLPRMMGVKDAEITADENDMMEPALNHGVKVISMGFLVDEDNPIVWRGPMAMGALKQMLFKVDWGDLDVLVMDMPPGTGDIQLSIAQQVALTGAVIVSTPQDIALLDAKKGVEMFKKVNIPVLGLVENMSTFVCPSCDHESHIFGHGGAREYAESEGMDVLGEVPLDLDIRTRTDNGESVLITMPDSKQTQIYRDIAIKVIEKLDAVDAQAETGKVKIVIE